MSDFRKRMMRHPGLMCVVRECEVHRSRFHAQSEQAAQMYATLYGVDRPMVIRRDMVRLYVRRGFTLNEYIDYRLFGKDSKTVAAYVSRDEMLMTFGIGKRNHLARNKYERFRCFKQFFHREIVYIDGADDGATYLGFISRHPRFIVKPVKGLKGHGVFITSAVEAPTLEALTARTALPVLIEALIEQGEELAAFHPASVNTLRLATAMDPQGRFSILFALFRSGCGESTVDNVGSGGLITLVDEETGVICTDALLDHRYLDRHPDTGKAFKGVRMPQWQTLLSLAEAAHRTRPDQEMIGWDFAWTVDGWDLVEANPSPSFASYQTLAGKGIRPRLAALLG